MLSPEFMANLDKLIDVNKRNYDENKNLILKHKEKELETSFSNMKKGEQDVVKELPLMIDHLIAVRNKFKNKYKNFIDSNRYYEIEQETLKKS